ncbi:MAG: peptide chain release factor N(5)-glutamine methyltransferase [Vulcanibacillus sp.]
MIIKEAYEKAALILEKNNIENASLNAEVLICSIYQWDRGKFILNYQLDMTADKYDQLIKMVERRVNNEPLQYITGVQNFYGRDFDVNYNVLIPRPETELLVEAVINEARILWGDKSITVADIGSGSGAIAITLSLEKEKWDLHAVDISKEALQLAANNAIKLKADVTFHQGNLLSPLIEKKIVVDMIVSNPPYIPTDDILQLSSEVKDYEPSLALDGGSDGLSYYREIIVKSHTILRSPGIIAFEIGIDQAKKIVGLLKEYGAKNVNEILDYQGIPRILIALF